MFWIGKDKIREYDLSLDFEEMLTILEGKNAEFYYEGLEIADENKRWRNNCIKIKKKIKY